jgi:VanZ family protein
VKRLFWLIAALVIDGSLYPWVFDFSRDGGISPWRLLTPWPPGLDRFVERDVVLNLLLYIPLVIPAFLMLARSLPERVAAALSVGIAAGLSTALELLQVYVPGRNPSLPDIECNTVGAVAGALLALRFRHTLDDWLRRRSAIEERPAALLLAAWAVAQWYPFFPGLSQHRLNGALLTLFRAPVVPLEVLTAAAEWFAAVLALCAISGPLRPRWLLAATLVWVPSRLLIGEGSFTAGDLGAFGIALALWVFIPDNARFRAATWLLGVTLVARELAPFHFSTRAAPFFWTPLAGALNADRQFAVITLARKAFDYGAEIWLLRQTGTTAVASTLAVAAMLLLLENIQRYLPGRTAEITDPLIALLMGIGLRPRKPLQPPAIAEEPLPDSNIFMR